MQEVISAVPLAEYKLVVTFANNEKKIYDMSNELSGVFECLKDPAVFNEVRVVYGAPTWLSPAGLELDICPDTLYAVSMPTEGVEAYA